MVQNQQLKRDVTQSTTLSKQVGSKQTHVITIKMIVHHNMTLQNVLQLVAIDFVNNMLFVQQIQITIAFFVKVCLFFASKHKQSQA